MPYAASGRVSNVKSSVEVHGGGAGGYSSVASTHVTTFTLGGRTYHLETSAAAPIAVGDRIGVAGRERGGIRRVTVLVNETQGYAINQTYALGLVFGLLLATSPLLGFVALLQMIPEDEIAAATWPQPSWANLLEVTWTDLQAVGGALWDSAGFLVLVGIPIYVGSYYLRESLLRYRCIERLKAIAGGSPK